MRNELEDILYESSPVFYRERILDLEETLMCFGFECGDGWFEPLLEFSKETRRMNGLASKHHICFVASQVKEKFGEIRVYWHLRQFPDFSEVNPDDEGIKKLFVMMDDAISTLTMRCWNTCEICGSVQDISTTTRGRMRRLCKKCAACHNAEIIKHHHKGNFHEPIHSKQ